MNPHDIQFFAEAHPGGNVAVRFVRPLADSRGNNGSVEVIDLRLGVGNAWQVATLIEVAAIASTLVLAGHSPNHLPPAIDAARAALEAAREAFGNALRDFRPGPREL